LNVIKQNWRREINLVYGIGFILIAAAFGFSVYVKTGQDFNSLLLAIYVFGLFAMIGVFGIFPGGTKVKNEWGDKVKVGNMNNLSKGQAFTLFVWFLVYGAFLVYRYQFRNAL
jgi:hypothetical protein